MAETSSTGALVPSVKSEPKWGGEAVNTSVSQACCGEGTTTAGEVCGARVEPDKDLLCPICMQVIKDAFLTACGHTFCYMCIVTHLNNKSDCPRCGQYLTTNQLYPNFLLNKLVKKQSAHQIAKNASPIEHLRLALQQGFEVSVKELDTLISLLQEKKRKMEQEEAETNMQILLDFLHCLKKQKIDELKEVQSDLQYIKEDMNSVERHRIELYRAKERYSMKLRMLADDDPMAPKVRSSSVDKHNTGFVAGTRAVQGSFQGKKVDLKAQGNSQVYQRKDAFSNSDPQNAISQSGLVVARKRRVHALFTDFQEYYLQKRRQGASQLKNQDEKTVNSLSREGYHAGLEDFKSVLTTFTRYSRLRVIAELRHGDLFHSANIVSSIEFDRDDELFAIAGVSRRIKVFEFSTVVNEPADVHLPVVEMPTRAKLSCLSWNKSIKNHIASSDYEGIVTVWDVTTRQSVMEYDEHEKRAWSVDFSPTDPSLLVSGSDDCKRFKIRNRSHIPRSANSAADELAKSGASYQSLVVKIWCTKQEASVLNIDMKANICCVKYNPGSSIYVAVGSADHHIHYYDLRNTSAPVHIFSGHRKAVSYVKFLSNNELASASTDSTLRLWDVREHCPVRTYRGHTNEKNFVGLTVNNEYIACGSETNEVFVYHKAIPKPAAWHKFGCSDMDDTDDDAGSHFISAVCWKRDSPTMLTANSQGTIKVLVLAA